MDVEVLAPAAAVRRRLPRPPALRRLVTTVWTHDLPGTATSVRVLPDAAIDLVVGGGRVRVAGPDTGAVVEHFPAGGSVVGFQLRPGAAAALLGVPASALRDERVDLEDLWGRAGRALTAAVDPTAPPGQVAAVVEARLAERVRGAPDGDPLAGPLLERVAGGRPVGDLADELGLGERQLRRRAGAAFGYGPKVLARVLRFSAAVDRLRAEPALPLADLAAEAGYADQAHLTHETRALSGLSPGRLRAALAMSVPDKTPAA
ncbi:MAG: DNA-binding protein [Acidimicrobiales bacterium]|nr:DNA-binding protein [Acidimicrobiales bacterium]